jgi:hypothetical protein
VTYILTPWDRQYYTLRSAQEHYDHKAPPAPAWDDGPSGEVIVALDCDDLSIACDWTAGDFDADLGDLWIVDATDKRILELPKSAVSEHVRAALQKQADAALDEHNRLDQWIGGGYDWR